MAFTILALSYAPLGGEPFATVKITERGNIKQKLATLKSEKASKRIRKQESATIEDQKEPLYFDKNNQPKFNQTPKKQSEKSDSEKDKKALQQKKAGKDKLDKLANFFTNPKYKTLPPAPIAEINEQSKYGPLPHIADNGKRPQNVYAYPYHHKHKINDKPAKHIALLISGLGLSEPITQNALDKLPGAITFSFNPYGRNLNNWMRRSREAGHELMLQLPMEPYDYPDNDPGPHTLLTSLSDDVNIERMHWIMARMSGYIGLINLFGSKFNANEGALYPILRELKNRGLFYMSGNPLATSVSQKVATDMKLDYLKSDIIIDQVKSAEEIDKSLAKLEKEAIKHGKAIGIASALPLTIQRIMLWSEKLKERGIVLVPLSATIPRRQS